MLYQRTVDDDATSWTLDIVRPTFADLLGALVHPPIALLYGTSVLAALSVSAYLITR